MSIWHAIVVFFLVGAAMLVFANQLSAVAICVGIACVVLIVSFYFADSPKNRKSRGGVKS